jgi:flavin reductase (DIM6/NTAB) family NADH-FMN oxidoreductase RutF
VGGIDVPRTEVNPDQLVFPGIGFWEAQWAVLSCGDYAARNFNCMTVSWGALGNMWARRFVLVVVRPTRHTYGFMEANDQFTFNVLPARYKPVLEILGTRSGRTMDKINQSGLTPIASSAIASPGFDEAELILQCRKIYFDDLEPGHFLAPDIHHGYRNDYHRMYFGHIVAAHASADYVQPKQV